VRITIKALGQVAEVLGEREFELELKRGNAMSSVRDALCREHPELVPLWPSLAVAVNGEFIEGGCPLKGGDEVLLLPPISGG
jgi:molybdopterin converting factor small subunit